MFPPSRCNVDSDRNSAWTPAGASHQWARMPRYAKIDARGLALAIVNEDGWRRARLGLRALPQHWAHGGRDSAGPNFPLSRKNETIAPGRRPEQSRRF